MKLMVLCLLFFSCKSQTPHRSVVEKVDLQRYAGTWFEIARYPHRFERNLVGVTATYTLLNDGRIDVLNQGYKGSLDGKLSRARAKAKVPDSAQPGKLKVYFFPLFGADYFILDLDQENYKYALVGSSSMNYLWILSRTPQMHPELYRQLTEKAISLGYDISKIEMVPQRSN
jgi:apolipoprotein D and lipocalin family protein